ncbi:MAG TPA: RNA methyltransferase [Candidatus Nitrosotalea sp.]|nr:RNA methyltransferase [Candidatus Nitrosotalea sp.]
MATSLGARSDRLGEARALRTVKGRREQRRFAFEGATLLEEALAAGFPIGEIFATAEAYESTPLLRRLDGEGPPVFILSPAAAKSLSDVETPSGIVAVAPVVLRPVAELLARGAPLLVLGDLNDPSNAGTLLRSADAFGAGGAAFGRLGVDPFHPKVVRGAMGAIFRLPVALTDPHELSSAVASAGLTIFGFAADGDVITDDRRLACAVIVIGHEKRGLGRWEAICERVLAIPMTGRSESLSAGVAGSIALYEAQRANLVKRVS